MRVLAISSSSLLFPAEPALLDPGVGIVVLVLGDLEGAGNHAEPAAEALVLAPDHGALLRLRHRPREARRRAGRGVAVHALALDEDLLPFGSLESVDHRPLRLGGVSPLPEDAVVVGIGNGKTVRLRTGLLASATTDALGGVDEHPVGIAGVLRRGGLASASRQRAAGHRPHTFQEVPSVHRKPSSPLVSSGCPDGPARVPRPRKRCPIAPEPRRSARRTPPTPSARGSTPAPERASHRPRARSTRLPGC